MRDSGFGSLLAWIGIVTVFSFSIARCVPGILWADTPASPVLVAELDDDGLGAVRLWRVTVGGDRCYVATRARGDVELACVGR